MSRKLAKREINCPKEKRKELLSQYGWTTKDIQIYFKISYRNAVEIFRNIALAFGTVKYDKRQIKVDDVLSFTLNSTVLKEQKRMAD